MLRNYDSKRIAVTWAGIPIDPGSGAGGYGPDNFLTIEATSDAFSTVVGVDGQVTRSPTHDRRARFTLRLMQSSPTNDLLSAAHELDRQVTNGAGVGPFQVKDLNGTTLYEAPETWIVKTPNAEFGQAATVREWVFECAAMFPFAGSNA